MSNIRLSDQHPAEESRSKKKLKRKSEVWDHFEESPDGENAKCKYCSKILSGKSKGGTSHLKRHLNICDKHPKGDMNQPLTLDSSDDDEVTNIGLTQKETCLEDVVKKAILDEVPFEFPDFQNGWYSSMELMDADKEIFAYYEREKKNLAIELNNVTSRICFSVDIKVIEDGFLSLTAHFINDDFNLVSKLINLKDLFDHSPSSMINMLESCISEWKLEKKIFTFTLQKHRFDGWDVLIEGLRETFSPKMLFGGHHIGVPCCKDQLQNEPYEYFFMSPFYCRGGDSTSKFLEVLTTVPSEIDTFNQIAKDMGLSPINETWFNDRAKVAKQFIWGQELLKHILIYREVFSLYYARTGTVFSGICSYSFHWQILELMIDNIPGLVACAENEFRSFKHPTSHLYLRKIFEIVGMIAIKRKNSECICGDGECGVDNYWKYLENQFVRFVVETEDIFIVAGVLDPRFKLSFFQYCMKEMGNFIGLEKKISHYREILNKFFSEYAKKEAEHVSPSLVGNINTQAHEGSSLNNNAYLPPTTITDRFSQHIRGMSELDEYLGEKVIDMGAAEFDLLSWWKQNQSRFPVLSRMARDILAVPADVYYVFNTIESDIETVEMVEDLQLLEAVICSKHWILDREKRDVSELKK